MKQFQIVSFLILSTSITSFCFGQNSKQAGILVSYSVKTGERLEVIVGVFLKSERDKIHIFDFKTFSEREIDAKNVIRKKIPLSQSEAASRIGVAPIVAWHLKDLIPKPPKPGKVALVDGAVIYVNLGKKSGIRVGSELDVFRGESIIKDPETGEVLGRNRRKIAKVEVTEVREKLSKVKLLGALELKLKVGDVVESDRKSRSIAVLSGTNAEGATLKSGVILSDEITSALSKFKVSIVERTKLIDVVHELVLQRTGVFDKKTVQKLGRQVGAYAVLSPTIIPSGRKSKVSMRLVEVETGKILFASSIDVPRIVTGIASTGGNGSPSIATNRSENILSQIRNPATYSYGGNWVLRKKKLSNTRFESKISLPIQPATDYDLSLSFKRTEGKDTLAIILPVENRNVTMVFSGNGGAQHGLNSINGVASGNRNDSGVVRPGILRNGQRYRALISVRVNKSKAKIIVSLDGKKIMTWEGNISSLSVHHKFIPPDRSRIGIAALSAKYEFDRIRLENK